MYNTAPGLNSLLSEWINQYEVSYKHAKLKETIYPHGLNKEFPLQFSGYWL